MASLFLYLKFIHYSDSKYLINFKIFVFHSFCTDWRLAVWFAADIGVLRYQALTKFALSFNFCISPTQQWTIPCVVRWLLWSFGKIINLGILTLSGWFSINLTESTILSTLKGSWIFMLSFGWTSQSLQFCHYQSWFNTTYLYICSCQFHSQSFR